MTGISGRSPTVGDVAATTDRGSAGAAADMA
jgi:hypothetical protein